MFSEKKRDESDKEREERRAGDKRFYEVERRNRAGIRGSTE